MRKVSEYFETTFRDNRPKIVWNGRPIMSLIGDESGAEDWHFAFVVEYRKGQFQRMFSDEKYRPIAAIRSAAVKNSRLIACIPSKL
jgi:hypothetical protein